MDNGRNETQLRTYLAQRFRGYRESLGPDDDLGSIIDSLGLFELVEYVEQEFGVSVPTAEFSPRRFASIRAIMALVEELKAS